MVPFEPTSGVEEYFDEPYSGVPVPPGTNVFYKCAEGKFVDGKSWHKITCQKKTGEFEPSAIPACEIGGWYSLQLCSV